MEATKDLATALQGYFGSIDLRHDTKISLFIGLAVGFAVVSLLVLYPGKPIDYSGTGIDVPTELRGGERGRADGYSGGKLKVEMDDPGDNEESTGTGEEGARDGATSGDGIGPRRRKGRGGEKKTAMQGASEGNEANIGEGNKWGAGMPGGGEFDLDKINEDKLAQKVVSAKAGKLLGITEEQVHQAVREAKMELQTGKDPAGGVEGLSLSTMLNLFMLAVAMGFLYIQLVTDKQSGLALFLQGLFPREMSVLGLMPDRPIPDANAH